MALAYAEGIAVEYWDFTPPLEAVYCEYPTLPPVIGLSRSLFRSRRHFRTVLAEELGHHFTTLGYQIPHEHYHYANRLQVGRAERRAIVWAAKHLIPEDSLSRALSRDIVEPWELADYFDVDEQLARLRLEALGGEKCYWARNRFDGASDGEITTMWTGGYADDDEELHVESADDHGAHGLIRQHDSGYGCRTEGLS